MTDLANLFKNFYSKFFLKKVERPNRTLRELVKGRQDTLANTLEHPRHNRFQFQNLFSRGVGFERLFLRSPSSSEANEARLFVHEEIPKLNFCGERWELNLLF